MRRSEMAGITQENEAVLSQVRGLTTSMKDLIRKKEYILSENLGWGQLYGGVSLDGLKGQAKKKLSVIRPVAHFLLMHVTQQLVLDKRATNRTIITMEEKTVIKQANGEINSQEKGSFVDLDKDADPPTITAVNGKDFDIVIVEWA